MAKPQHSAALKIAIFDSPLLTNFRIPNHSAQRQCSSRRHNVDACAVEHDIIRAEHKPLKSVQGLGVKAAFGAKRQTSSKCKAFAIQRCNGGRTQVALLSPLTKLTTFRIVKRCFASLNMTRFQLSLRGKAEAINRIQS